MSGLSFRRVDRGLSLTWDHRYEVMFCYSGFFSPRWIFEATRNGGFLRICIGPARLWFVWPDRRVA